MDKIYSRPRIKFPKIPDKIGKSKNNSKIKKVSKISNILFVALCTLNLVVTAINPIIDTQCNVIAKSIATKVCNEQASLVMNKYKYEDLCNLVKDSNGNISLISANVVTINEIISGVAVKIQEELNNVDNGKFHIRLGNLTGSKLFSGRGPNIEVKMSTVGNVETDLKSEFVSSGINQTLHKVYLEVKCNVIVLTPFNSIEQKIVNQVLLSEAVIVGITPNTYYNLDGMSMQGAIDVIE